MTEVEATSRFKPGEGDWICDNDKCKNVNFAKRIKCNKCGQDRTPGQEFKKTGSEIGKQLAEKSKGLFSADDWMCKACGNVNWARRNTCNMCNSPKFGNMEPRTGYGGGYMERELNVEYKEKKADSDDDEFDQFGRKKKKYRGQLIPESALKVVENKAAESEEEEDEEDDEDVDMSKYNLESEEDDDDDVDLSKYKLSDDDDDDNKKKDTQPSTARNGDDRSRKSSSSSSSESSSSSSSRSRSRSNSRSYSGSKGSAASSSKKKRSSHDRSRSRSMERRKRSSDKISSHHRRSHSSSSSRSSGHRRSWRSRSRSRSPR